MTVNPMAGAGEDISLPGRSGDFFALNTECMLYVGRFGATSMRMLGSVTIYVSLDQPFLLKHERGTWRECDCAILPPRVTHQIDAPDPLVSVLIEPESMDFANLAACDGSLDACGAELVQLRDSLRALEKSVRSDSSYAALLEDALDAVFDGGGLRRKTLDPRIGAVLDRIDVCAEEPPSAEQCAQLTGLSFSRFLHLFKEEVGLNFRCFKAWKRARRLLYFMDKNPNLTDIALEIGYPDSSYFSHSIRHVYGLRPKDIFERSRFLGLHTYPSVSYSY